MDKAKVISCYNRKGGIGKTTAVVNIGAQLSMFGRKVLIIDGDPQINLTQYFFRGDENFFDDQSSLNAIKEGIPTLYDVLSGDEDIRSSVRELNLQYATKSRKNKKNLECSMDILPGSPDMVYYGTDDYSVLARILDQIKEEYDYIIIDFPPSFNSQTAVYLYASDYIIVPLRIAEEESNDGYLDLINRVDESHEDGGHVEILGLFYTFVHQNWKSHQELCDFSKDEQLRESMPFFDSFVREISSVVTSAKFEHVPLCLYAEGEKVTNDYRELANEIEERIKAR